MLRVLVLLLIICSCSPKVRYTQDSIRKNGGVERQKQIKRITKHNQYQMNRVRKKVSDNRGKNLKRRRKYN